jgi:uncharacterized membrane protein YhaH (DUF805 family)
MGPVEAIKAGLRKAFVFSGRASRSEFWFFYLFYSLIVSLAGFTIASLTFDPSGIRPDSTGFWIFAVVWCALAIPTFSALVRRWHDTNHSGWWFIGICIYISVIKRVTENAPPVHATTLLLFAPIFLAIVWLEVMLFWPGTKGPNRYGADPLEFSRTD